MVIERMMALKESDLEEFVCDNFKLRSSVEGDNSRLMIGAEEKTAFDIIDSIYDEIAESYSDSVDPFAVKVMGEERAEYNEDRNYIKKIAIEWDVYKLLKIAYGADEKFMHVVNAIDTRLNTRAYGLKSYRIPEITQSLKRQQRAAEVQAANAASARVTRSGMLAAMYQEFIMEIEDIGGDYENLMDMYNSFTSRYDGVLDEARYQRISPKNLLDMYVIISLYFRVIIEKGEAEGEMFI